jgi:hypothetical protein
VLCSIKCILNYAVIWLEASFEWLNIFRVAYFGLRAYKWSRLTDVSGNVVNNAIVGHALELHAEQTVKQFIFVEQTLQYFMKRKHTH